MTMTIEEARQMVGTAFEFFFTDGDSIQAYVKMFDPEIGMTCLTLKTETKQGWKPPSDGNYMEDDGTWCVTGFNFSISEHRLKDALEDLEEIRNTGQLLPKKEGFEVSPLSRPATCAFS